MRAATPPSAPNSLGELPPGAINLYYFATLNALSYQPILGSPMVLYAKSLGASATVLGILAGMMPLLVITQIPAAKFLGRIGYQRFVLTGWSTRVAVIFLIALLPLTGGFLDRATQLILLLALLLAFNVFRGISSAAWLPWIMELVPATLRGRHFAREQVWTNGASFVVFACSALMLGGHPTPARFGAVFLFSALAGAISLPYLRKVPDCPPPPEAAGGKGPVPWRALAGHPPFRKLLELNVAWSVAYGGVMTFVVKFLKDGAQMPDDRILLLMSVSFAGGLFSPWLMGPRLDRLGSRPLLAFTMATGVVMGVGWWLIAAGLAPAGNVLVLPLVVCVGLVNAVFSAANNRLAMQLAPAMGRDHFFALFMVVWQLTLGLSPVLWGLLLDLVGPWSAHGWGADWNRYSIYFALVAGAFGVAFWLCQRLDEPKAAEFPTLMRELLLDEPRRWWLLLTGR